MDLRIGQRVRSGCPGVTFGWVGPIVEPIAGYQGPERVWIHWEGNLVASVYRPDSEVVEKLHPVEVEANAVTVAQALSRVIERESLKAESLTGGLFLDEDADDDLRVTEVGAQLHADVTGQVRSFYVKTSDGKEFRVSVAAV